jgi:hypothetical protein
MAKTYLTHKQGKKSFALKGIWVLIVLAIIFAVILVRFAISGTKFGFSRDLPGSDEAYAIAKQFIKPTIKSSNINFPDSGYQCARKDDSTYMIKSYVDSKTPPGEKSTIPFEITIKFNGGAASDKKNWKVIYLNEN